MQVITVRCFILRRDFCSEIQLRRTGFVPLSILYQCPPPFDTYTISGETLNIHVWFEIRYICANFITNRHHIKLHPHGYKLPLYGNCRDQIHVTNGWDGRFDKQFGKINIIIRLIPIIPANRIS